MHQVLTHNLENTNNEFKEVINNMLTKISKTDYVYNKFTENFKLLSELIVKHKVFPQIEANEFYKVVNNIDLYIDALTYHVIRNYENFVKNDDLPVYCYLYIIIVRPYIYNVLACMRTNNEIIKFKNDMLEHCKELLINNKSNEIVKIHDLLITNEFSDYDRVSSLQLFKYFIDTTFNQETTYKGYSSIINEPNVTYIIIHLSYNNTEPKSIFTYNDVKRDDIISLTESYAKNTKLFNEFDNIYIRDKPYEIVDYNFQNSQLCDNNVFVICYDNDKDLKKCLYTQCQFINQNIKINKKDAENKLNGMVYKSIAFERVKTYFDISNSLKNYDDPVKVDDIKKMKFKAFIDKLVESNKNYKCFLKSLNQSNEIESLFDNESELFYFKLYMKGYDEDYVKYKICQFADAYYN